MGGREKKNQEVEEEGMGGMIGRKRRNEVEKKERWRRDEEQEMGEKDRGVFQKPIFH